MRASIFTSSPSPLVNNKRGQNVSFLPRRIGFSVFPSVARKEPARRYRRRARLLGHVRQISPNARDGGYRRALSRIFYLRYTKRYIRAIFTPACAASFTFYRAATRYLEYTLSGCISHSVLYRAVFLFFFLLYRRMYRCKNHGACLYVLFFANARRNVS